MRRATFLAGLLAVGTAGCSGFDKFLEGSQPSEARFRLALGASEVTIIAGRDSAIAVTITRTGDFTGAVPLTLEGNPSGVTVEFGGAGATGQVTSATVTLRVSETTKPGRYPLRVRGHVAEIPVDGIAPLVLYVSDPASYSVTMGQASLTVVRGGIAPVAVQLQRTNYTAPVTLALEGVPQVSAGFPENPVTGTATTMTLSVAALAVPGTYQATLRASAPGLADRIVPVTIIISADPLQLLVGPVVEAGQGSISSVAVIINRPGVSGTVTLSAESLPAGVTAEFDPATPSGTTATLRFTVQPTVPAATYPLRLRGHAAGVSDATADFQLRVTPSGLGLTFSPGSATVYQGTGTTLSLTLTRTALPGAIALSIPGLPAGLTATVNPGSATGTIASLSVQAASSLPAGVYPVTVRSVPASWPAGAHLDGTFNLTVRTAFPATEGNFRLDWSGCAPPDWVAYIQGGDPLGWRPITPVSGRVQFHVTGTGGVAWVESGNSVNVRWLTGADVPGAPVDMCPPAPLPQGKTITGQAIHFSAQETFRFLLGGATAATTVDASTVTLSGVPSGVHDLVGWGEVSIGTGLRGLLRRDVDLPDGASLGPLDLTGAESFAPARAPLTVTSFSSGESISHSMSYGTTLACTGNLLYSGFGGTTATMAGIPPELQRSSDFHVVAITGSLGARVRTITTSFQTLISRSIALPTLTGVPVPSPLAGSYKRLQVVVGNVSGSYNRGVSFRYSAGVRSMTMSATLGFTGTAGVTLTMPDFSGAAGWPAAAAIPSGGTGGWVFTAEGASGGASSCSEGRTAVFLSHSGAY